MPPLKRLPFKRLRIGFEVSHEFLYLSKSAKYFKGRSQTGTRNRFLRSFLKQSLHFQEKNPGYFSDRCIDVYTRSLEWVLLFEFRAQKFKQLRFRYLLFPHKNYIGKLLILLINRTSDTSLRIGSKGKRKYHFPDMFVVCVVCGSVQSFGPGDFFQNITCNDTKYVLEWLPTFPSTSLLMVS